MTTSPVHYPVPPTLDDHPDIERVPYPEPEVGTTQNDDDQAGEPPADHDYGPA